VDQALIWARTHGDFLRQLGIDRSLRADIIQAVSKEEVQENPGHCCPGETPVTTNTAANEDDFFGKRPFRPDSIDEEAGAEFSLRPKTFDDFVGQTRVTENLLIAIETALERGDTLDHVLLSGMPGLGKTTLAGLIARAMGVEMRSTSGPVIEHGKDLLGVLTSLKKGDVLFIDEIHRMTPDAEEYLYSAMEDFFVDIVVDRGADARTYTLQLQPFTLIGATTREGLLSAPFRSRFQIQEKLDAYADDELALIVTRSAVLLGTEIVSEAALELAHRSRGTPRFANRFLRRIRDVAQYRQSQIRRRQNPEVETRVESQRTADEPAAAKLLIDLPAVEDGLARLGVDATGLDRIDRRILSILVKNGECPTGIKTLSVSIGEETRTLEEVYEPYLIQRGLIVKTPRGRLATSRGAELVATLTPSESD
jgi:Holliday junction DNA helicase RuvB